MIMYIIAVPDHLTGQLIVQYRVKLLVCVLLVWLLFILRCIY